MRDDSDIKRQVKSVYARGNMLIQKFRSCSTDVKLRLFQTHLSNLYCSHLWSAFSTQCLKKLKEAYNNVFGTLLGLKRDCSISMAYVKNNISGFDTLLRNCINGFNRRLYDSDNLLISSIVHSTYFVTSSINF